MFRLPKRFWVYSILIILFILSIIYILPVSIPLLLAFITALILNPAVRWLEFRFKLTRKLAVIVMFIFFIGVVGTSGSFIVVNSISQLVDVAERLPTYIDNVNNLFLQWEEDIELITEELPEQFIEQLKQSIEDSLSTFNDTINEYLTIDNLTSIAASIPNYLVSIIVYLIALFLFMLDLPKLKSQSYNLMTENTAEKVRFMNARLSYVIVGFFKAQFLVSIIIFIVSLIGLLFIIPNVALIMSLIIWIIDFIPIIGSIIILGPWALFMFFAGHYAMGIKLTILAIILLTIRRTVEPKVMGHHIGLSPLATLIAMYLGLKLLGILGFIIGPLLLIAFNSAKEAGIIKINFKI
ncbi:sporulation integral membrane protein YtvI [Bacillaceae bacterium S4-13-58]